MRTNGGEFSLTLPGVSSSDSNCACTTLVHTDEQERTSTNTESTIRVRRESIIPHAHSSESLERRALRSGSEATREGDGAQRERGRESRKGGHSLPIASFRVVLTPSVLASRVHTRTATYQAILITLGKTKKKKKKCETHHAIEMSILTVLLISK